MTRNQIGPKMENIELQIHVRHSIFVQIEFGSQVFSGLLVFNSTELIVIGRAKLTVHLLKLTHLSLKDGLEIFHERLYCLS